MSDQQSKPPKRVAVVGAGLMGHALALVFALGGHRVRITDQSPAMLAEAHGLIEKAARTLIDAGEIDATWTPARLAEAITAHESLAETVADAEIVIEAITERADWKAALFEQLDALTPEDAILASNTSNLDVFPLIPKRRWPRAIITHWYTPPYLVDLVDVVPTPETDPAVTEEVTALLTAMGKEPVVFARFITGYVANRIQDAISLEVFRLLDEGYVTRRGRRPLGHPRARAAHPDRRGPRQGRLHRPRDAADQPRQRHLPAAARHRPVARARRRPRRRRRGRPQRPRLLRLGRNPGGRALRGARPPADRAQARAARHRPDGAAMIHHARAGKTALVTGRISG